MPLKFNVTLITAVIFLPAVCALGPALAQEGQDTVMRQELIQPPAPVDESEMQWVWGEVVSVDAQSKTIAVKYLDYETDQEKDMTINVDDKTLYDNVKSLDGIAPKDTLSIDYIVTADNLNLARNISKEAAEVAGETE